MKGETEVSWAMLAMLLLGSYTLGVWSGGYLNELVHPKPVVTVEPIHQPILPLPTPPMVMRDARIICLSAILAKTPRSNWAQITREEAHSGNVCTVAQFLYPKDIPENVEGAARKVAIEAIDHG